MPDMNTQELADYLRKSLADHKFTGSEKSALSEWLAANVQTDQERGLARHTGFEVAIATVSDPETAKLIEWLEDVMRVLVPMNVASGERQRSEDDTTPVAVAPRSPGDHHAYFSPGERCLQQIIHRFDTCSRTADVCVFTITDDRISREILAAHRRGVKVRIISDNEKWHDLGSDIQQFREAGISVKVDDAHHHAGPHRNGHMHHKFAIFDGTQLLNGSYNWTRGAANENYENLIDTDDPKLVAAFATEFKRLWNRF